MNINELKRKLTTKLWPCKCSKISLSLLNPISELPESITSQFRVNTTYTGMNGVTVTETHNDPEGLMEQLYGDGHRDVGAEYMNLFNIVPIENCLLTIEQIARVLFKLGTVELSNPDSAGEMYQDIKAYLILIENNERLSVHFTPVDEDVIAMYRMLKDKLHAVVHLTANYEHPDNIHTKLRGAFVQGLPTKDTSVVLTPKPAPERIIGAYTPSPSTSWGF